MNIVLTGGGSGGHITPILAVAHELKRQQPDCAITYIGQRQDQLLDVVERNPAIDSIETIWAGKLRRYSGEGWRQLLDIRSQLLNIRDIFRTVLGIWQSYRLLGRLRPAAVFTRGGYVSVPVAIAAKLRRIPYITHDSDSTPSLANRLIARWAQLHAVALPAESYPYPVDKIAVVGIPVDRRYRPVSAEQKKKYRQELQLAGFDSVVLITGGGNGAQRLNTDAVQNARYLLSTFPDLVVLHIAGRSLEEETNNMYDEMNLGAARQRVRVYGFVRDMYRYSGSADIIVARGGATNLAEFALQARAVVIVPSSQLIWNVRNSHALQKRDAIIELSEEQAEQPERLGRVLGDLLNNPARRAVLSQNIAAIAMPNAAEHIAKLILEVGTGGL